LDVGTFPLILQIKWFNAEHEATMSTLQLLARSLVLKTETEYDTFCSPWIHNRQHN
jgi:hypothetical protein